MDDLPGNEIVLFMHCGMCIEDKPDDISPQDWARIEVGWTEKGLQVWCKRHGCNMIHMDFEGQKHPADTRA